MITYERPNCPTCGEVLAGECDLIPARACVVEIEPGKFEYTGDTEEFWDGQENEVFYEHNPRDPDAEIRVECEHAHQWLTRRTME